LVLAFSPDDKTLVWEDWEHPETGIVLADAATGQELRRLKSNGRNSSETAGDVAAAIAFSPDGERLAVSWWSGAMELWDLKSGKQMVPTGKVSSALFEQQTNWWNLVVRPALAFSPDGKKLVCSLGGATVRQFHADTGAEIPGAATGHRAPVSTLALSADGKSLCTYSSGDPARCWDWMAGKETARLTVPADATQAAFAADGRFAVAAGHEFTLCDADGKPARKLAVGGLLPESLALSPDCTLLATRNFMSPEVHLLDAATLKEKFALAKSDALSVGGMMTETTGVLPTDLVFSPDGRNLAAAGPSRQLCVWDVTRGALVWELPPQAGLAIERFAFSRNGRVLAAVDVDHTVSLYEVVSGAKRARLGEPDAKLRKTYLTDGTWGPVIQLKGHQGGVVSLLFSSDGKHLFSGGTDTTVLTWDLTRLSRLETGRAAELPVQAVDGLWTDLADKDAARAFAAMVRALPRRFSLPWFSERRLRPATCGCPGAFRSDR
jgi:WD40 repeat protein